MRSSVVLPQPDGPSSAKNSPCWMSIETSERAVTFPNLRDTPRWKAVSFEDSVSRVMRWTASTATTLMVSRMVARALMSGVTPNLTIE